MYSNHYLEYMTNRNLILPFYVDSEAGGTLPTRGHSTDAGADLYVSEDVLIPPHEFRDVPTGVYCKIPRDTWGLLTGRSSTLRTHGLMVVQGVIDQDYTGELFVALQNMRSEPVQIRAGMRLAQIIIIPMAGALRPQSVPREFLGKTERGEGGFGSTGV